MDITRDGMVVGGLAAEQARVGRAEASKEGAQGQPVAGQCWPRKWAPPSSTPPLVSRGGVGSPSSSHESMNSPGEGEGRGPPSLA